VQTNQSVIYICQQDIILNLVAGYVYVHVCVLVCVCVCVCVTEYVQFESCLSASGGLFSLGESEPGHREHTYFGLPTSAAKSYGLLSTGFPKLCTFCRYFVAVPDLLARQAFTFIGTVMLIISELFYR
jgi:hypothetical protein